MLLCADAESNTWYPSPGFESHPLQAGHVFATHRECPQTTWIGRNISSRTHERSGRFL